MLTHRHELSILSSCIVALSCVLMSATTMHASEEDAIREAVARVSPSVLRLELLGGSEASGANLETITPATALVMSDDGYLAMSSYFLARQPSAILVQLPEGRVPAKIVARDHAAQLTLLKVETKDKLPPPIVAPRSSWRVGQTAIAVGLALDARQPNVSVGIVSALERMYGRALQTDAKISPANYGGPLVDLQGRVIGVLTPFAIEGMGDPTGGDFYDSGIGFAVGLESWLTRLATLRAGNDLKPGVLGVALKPGDPYTTYADIAVARLQSPAAKAGLKMADRLIELNDTKITRQMQLRHALGKCYAGDTIHGRLLRDGKEIEFELELIDKLAPYVYPWLGILPEPGDKDLRVRFVFPESPAATAGIQPGDRITWAAGREVTNRDALRQLVQSLNPGHPLSLKLKRDDRDIEVSLKLAPLSVTVPRELPAVSLPPRSEATTVTVGVRDLKLPEEKQECWLYVPSEYRADAGYGLFVWFAPPGKLERDAAIAEWKTWCDARRLLLLVPRPAQQGRWQASETAIARKFVDGVCDEYDLDRERVVAHGEKAGGFMSWLMSLEHRDMIRGVAVVDSPFPTRASAENDPVERQFVWSLKTTSAGSAKAISEGERRLREAKIPLTELKRTAEGSLATEEREQLFDWLDALNRL